MQLRNRFRREPEVHTSALNDILFILLLFFLIVSTLANPNVIKVNNPSGKKDTKTKQNIVISINREDQFFIGQKEIPDDQLDEVVAQEVYNVRKYIDTPSVVINADTGSTTGGFFKIMMAAKKVGARVVANIKE